MVSQSLCGDRAETPQGCSRAWEPSCRCPGSPGTGTALWHICHHHPSALLLDRAQLVLSCDPKTSFRSCQSHSHSQGAPRALYQISAVLFTAGSHCSGWLGPCAFLPGTCSSPFSTLVVEWQWVLEMGPLSYIGKLQIHGDCSGKSTRSWNKWNHFSLDFISLRDAERVATCNY